MNWFLIPARPENIDRSIRNPVDPTDLRQFLGEAESKRLAALGDGELRCWAMSDGSKAQFAKMAPGDYVLISERGTKKFNYIAEVTAKITNKDLGSYLWPVKPRANEGSGKRNSWEFIYFLKNLRTVDVQKSELLVLLGHELNDFVAGSRQLDSKKLSKFEGENGPLLEWLRTHARLDLPMQQVPVVTGVQREPPVVVLPPKATVGKEYVPATVTLTYDVSDQVFTYNAEEVERGKKGHVETQNALAKFLEERGYVPLGPVGEPRFDLAWVVGETVFVAEVKSTTRGNEEHQLRLGLGQVLRYCHQMPRDGRQVVAVLVPEREPSTSAWLELCAELGVYIGWPGAFERVLGPPADAKPEKIG